MLQYRLSLAIQRERQPGVVLEVCCLWPSGRLQKPCRGHAGRARIRVRPPMPQRGALPTDRAPRASLRWSPAGYPRYSHYRGFSYARPLSSPRVPPCRLLRDGRHLLSQLSSGGIDLHDNLESSPPACLTRRSGDQEPAGISARGEPGPVLAAARQQAPGSCSDTVSAPEPTHTLTGHPGATGILLQKKADRSPIL